MTTEAFQPITFHWVDAMLIQLAVYFNIATNTNPSSARPPYWRRVSDDTPEGRRELARRIAVVRAHDDHALHGTERWEHIAAWAEKEDCSMADFDFVVPEHLRWTPPAADPDAKHKREAHRMRVESNASAFLNGAPLEITPTWEQLRDAELAKLAAAKELEDGKARATSAATNAAALEKGIQELQKKITSAERIAKSEALEAETERIRVDRIRRGKKRLDLPELRSRAAASLQKAGK